MYTAIVLTQESQELLKNMFRPFCELHTCDWKLHCHHMTIEFGMNREESIASHFIGKKITITCKEIGYSDNLGVCALKVETEVPSLNKIKHITIYTMEKAKPVESNKITNWEAVKGLPFILEGFVETCI